MPESGSASTVMMVYVTASSRAEAAKIGRVLVEERLAACANVHEGVTSFYWWEGSVQEDAEASLILKTRTELVDALTARVRELHSYTVPCVVAWPIACGNPAYLEWLAAEARGREDDPRLERERSGASN